MSLLDLRNSACTINKYKIYLCYQSGFFFFFFKKHTKHTKTLTNYNLRKKTSYFGKGTLSYFLPNGRKANSSQIWSFYDRLTSTNGQIQIHSWLLDLKKQFTRKREFTLRLSQICMVIFGFPWGIFNAQGNQCHLSHKNIYLNNYFRRSEI